jgi:hypothetical protein
MGGRWGTSPPASHGRAKSVVGIDYFIGVGQLDHYGFFQIVDPVIVIMMYRIVIMIIF